jgi:hypothetical protein
MVAAFGREPAHVFGEEEVKVFLLQIANVHYEGVCEAPAYPYPGRILSGRAAVVRSLSGFVLSHARKQTR